MTSKFKRGSGCFTCKACGKQTRDTNGNGSVGLCDLCEHKCMCGNTLSDGGYEGDAWAVFAGCTTIEECNDILTKHLPAAE